MLVFEFHHNLRFSVSSQFEFLRLITIWVLSFVTRGTMFCWTLKLKKVLNEQILSASVPEAAV